MKLIFFTGAGISAASGIPTFAEQEGLRDKLTRSFAIEHPLEYRETIKELREVARKAEPNAAHFAIAKMNCPVITMNIDDLHERAGTKEENLIKVHGRLPEDHELYADNFHLLHEVPVLYDDAASKYRDAVELVRELDYGDSTFVIVGTSFYTLISDTLRNIAYERFANIIIVNKDAETEIPKLCEMLKREGKV